MGLDISAYSNLVKIRDLNEGEEANYETEVEFFVNYAFEGREDQIEEAIAYKYDEEYDFRAGSYGSYNHWRNQLAELAKYPLTEFEDFIGNVQQRYDAGAWEVTKGPFWELINFSDCEGVIGAATSAKLAKDFDTFQSAADAHPNKYFIESYNCWRKAFEMAANNGAVEFR